MNVFPAHKAIDKETTKFLEILDDEGFPFSGLASAQFRHHRGIALYPEGCAFHFVPHAHAACRGLGTDLDTEAVVLALMGPHMGAAGIAVPRVIRRWVTDEGIWQERTFVPGPTAEESMVSSTFNAVAFARSLGQAIAHLHTFPVSSLPQQDNPFLDERDITDEVVNTVCGEPLRGHILSVRDAYNLLARSDPDLVCIHNDLHAGNICVNPHTSEVTGLLDFEYCYAGSPHKEFTQLGARMTPPLRERVCAAYTVASGRAVDRRTVQGAILCYHLSKDLYALDTGAHNPEACVRIRHTMVKRLQAHWEATDRAPAERALLLNPGSVRAVSTQSEPL